MFLRLKLFAFLLFTVCIEIHAQSIVKGKIYDAKTDSVVAAVNVYNLNTKQSTRSDLSGSYSIIAEEGDQLVFSIVGYTPDTTTVVYSMLLAQHDVTLRNEVIT
jgi:hypothetical protein